MLSRAGRQALRSLLDVQLTGILVQGVFRRSWFVEERVNELDQMRNMCPC
jgi:hypothetical protein